MKKRINIFSLIVIAAILVSSLTIGKAVASDFKELGKELNISSKNGMQLESLFLSQTASPVKKCFTGLFFERVRSIFFFRASFSLYLETYLLSPPVKAAFIHISINAP